MLRTALKILLALALIAQGGVSAFAQDGVESAAKTHCQHADEHGKQTKMPCCPDGCLPDSVAACAACAIVFILPALPLTLPSARVAVGPDAAVATVASTPAIPPTRPPIV